MFNHNGFNYLMKQKPNIISYCESRNIISVNIGRTSGVTGRNRSFAMNQSTNSAHLAIRPTSEPPPHNTGRSQQPSTAINLSPETEHRGIAPGSVSEAAASLAVLLFYL